jgi:hypothetical protein
MLHYKYDCPSYGNPSVFVKRAYDIPSVYSDINSAIAAAVPGIVVTVFPGNYTLSGNVSVPTGVTLKIKSSATVNLNDYYIVSTGGTITIEPGVNIIGHRAIVSTPSSVMGIYPLSYTIQQLINLSSSGWSINLVPGTYTENLNMKSEVSVVGSGSTIITGTVTFDNDANASLTGSTVNGKITILSNSTGVTLSDITAGSSSCYLDVTGQSAYVINFNSNYSQSYSVWVNNAS